MKICREYRLYITILTFYSISKNEECTLYRYDFTFVNVIQYAAQLTIVNRFVFLSF